MLCADVWTVPTELRGPLECQQQIPAGFSYAESDNVSFVEFSQIQPTFINLFQTRVIPEQYRRNCGLEPDTWRGSLTCPWS